MSDSYRGPVVTERGGRGMGSWIWVLPGQPGPSDEELKEMGISMVVHWNRSMELEIEAEERMADLAIEAALEAAQHADNRPGYEKFFYDPDEDGEIDEFVDLVFVPASEVPELGAAFTVVHGIETVEGSHPRRVVIGVLGPVRVTGWLIVPERKVLTELATYLALHADRLIHGDDLRFALWPHPGTEASAKSLRTYMSELRKCLGADVVPLARDNGYGFSDAVESDWGRFEMLDQQSRHPDADQVALLKEALGLVRGRPFADVDYSWAFSDLLVSRMEVAIGEAVRRLVQVARYGDDHATALFAVRRGLLANQFDLNLWELGLHSAAQVGGDELARMWRDAQVTLGEDAQEFAELVRRLEIG